MFRQTKNVVLYMAPVILANALPLVTLPIFTRQLTKEDYGVWALAQVYAIFVTGIANFGLTIGYERNFFEQREPAKAAGLLYATLLFVSSALFLFGLITYLWQEVLARLVIGSADYAGILFWSYCATAVVGLKNYYLIYFKNTENARAYAWYTIDETLLGLGLSLVLVAWLRIGVIGLIWGQLAASSLITALLTVRFARSLPVTFNRAALRDSLRISLPLTPRVFFGVIGTQFDKYMLGLLNTVGGAGIYNIAQKIANAVFTCMTAIQNVYSPQVYGRMFSPKAEEGRTIGPYLTPFLYISGFVGLLVALFAEEVLSLLTPKEYHGGADVVTILSLLYVTYFFGKQPQLIYAKKTFLTSVLTLVNIGLNVMINIPFIYQWGVIGAAWGALISGLITGAVSFYLGQHYYRIYWEYGKIGLIFLILYGSGLMVILLREAGVYYGIRAAAKLIALSGYCYLGFQLDILVWRNLLLVKNMFSAVPQPAGAPK
jgi:O-antigen/teichoic acid export membrane protein